MEADDLKARDIHADQVSDRHIADRLDALEAEKVMQRALEIEAEMLDEPHTISTEQLERIAKEIGVDAAFVHQALGEIRLQPAERSRFERWVLPQDLVETDTVTGLSREDLDAAIEKWMITREGLTKGNVTADGVEWDIDRRWRAKARASTLSGNNRISRVAGGDIAHQVHSVGELEHAVALGSKGTAPLMLARAAIGLAVLTGSILLAGAMVSGDFLAGLGVFSAFAAVGTFIGVAGARWWARGIRGALRRSLVGLVGAAKPKRKGWLSRLRRKD